MYRQRFLVPLVIGIILLLVILVSLSMPFRALAQCGEPPESTCMTCHAKEAPVSDEGEWHIIHAGKDICVNCHGGNASATDKALAHEGMMTEPLVDIYTDCHSCHPADYEARAAQFAPTLGVTPGSCSTPTPVAVSNLPGGPPSGNIAMPSDLVGTAPLPAPFWIIGGGAAMLAFFFLALRWLAGRPG
jgi:hypothetical protein